MQLGFFFAWRLRLQSLEQLFFFFNLCDQGWKFYFMNVHSHPVSSKEPAEIFKSDLNKGRSEQWEAEHEASEVIVEKLKNECLRK